MQNQRINTLPSIPPYTRRPTEGRYTPAQISRDQYGGGNQAGSVSTAPTIVNTGGGADLSALQAQIRSLGQQIATLNTEYNDILKQIKTLTNAALPAATDGEVPFYSVAAQGYTVRPDFDYTPLPAPATAGGTLWVGNIMIQGWTGQFASIEGLYTNGNSPGGLFLLYSDNSFFVGPYQDHTSTSGTSAFGGEKVIIRYGRGNAIGGGNSAITINGTAKTWLDDLAHTVGSIQPGTYYSPTGAAGVSGVTGEGDTVSGGIIIGIGPGAAQTVSVTDSTGTTYTGSGLVLPNGNANKPTTGPNAGKVVITGFGGGDTFG